MNELTTLECWRAELEYALFQKSLGVRSVDELVVGEKLAAGRGSVPIDECINHWKAGIKAMEAGADQEQFNY